MRLYNDRHRGPVGRSNLLVISFILFCFLLGSASVARAEDTAATEDPVFQEVQRLKALKTSDPQAYAEAVRQKKENVGRRLTEMKQNRPENFQQFMARENQLKRRRLVEAQNRNPELFNQYREGRVQRFKQMEAQNPERVKQLLEKHPQLRERMECGRETPRQNFPPRLGAQPPQNRGEQMNQSRRAEMNQGGGPAAAGERRPFQPAGQRQGMNPAGSGFDPQRAPFRQNGSGPQRGMGMRPQPGAGPQQRPQAQGQFRPQGQGQPQPNRGPQQSGAGPGGGQRRRSGP